MKTKKWLAAIFLLLSMGTACIAATKEPAPAGVKPLQVVQLGAMSVERAAHQATLLNNGQVLVTGGCARQGCEIYHASTEIFDPATNKFYPTGEMSVPRVKHAAALLADGRLLIIGGSDTRGYRSRFTSTEIYAPTNGDLSLSHRFFGRIFETTFRGIPHADDQRRPDFSLFDEPRHGSIDAPGHAAKSVLRVKQVLPVVHVKHGKTLGWIPVVPRRQPDIHPARIHKF
jgi:Galactose oxidase, central domain